jgi:hypothetical protein
VRRFQVEPDVSEHVVSEIVNDIQMREEHHEKERNCTELHGHGDEHRYWARGGGPGEDGIAQAPAGVPAIGTPVEASPANVAARPADFAGRPTDLAACPTGVPAGRSDDAGRSP